MDLLHELEVFQYLALAAVASQLHWRVLLGACPYLSLVIQVGLVLLVAFQNTLCYIFDGQLLLPQKDINKHVVLALAMPRMLALSVSPVSSFESVEILS